MANFINLDRPRRLVFSFDSMEFIEDYVRSKGYDTKGIADCMGLLESANMTVMKGFIYSCILEDCEGLTMKDLGPHLTKIFKDKKQKVLMESIRDALKESGLMPEDASEEGQDEKK